MKTKKKLTVSELNKLINTEISLSPFLQNVEVEAEIGRITKHSSGHYYFVIKDNHSTIDCIMFKSAVSKLKSDFFEGDYVTLKGRVSIYEQNARLQLYVSTVEHLGEGKFLKEFYELKEKLSLDGVFDSKKDLVDFPSKIALLTSKSSAAIKDYKKILYSRNPFVELVDYEINMQSSETPNQIINALVQIDESVDLVVITRGGGSYEDLRYFNDEALARFVSNFKTPIISAIGHEIDYTIIEFASDYRAATPSEAATMSTSNVYEYLEEYNRFIRLMNSAIKKDLSIFRLDANGFMDNIEFSARKQISGFINEMDKLLYESESFVKNKILIEREKLDKYYMLLQSLNPLYIMEKGYSVSIKDGEVINSIDDINLYDNITVRFKDGELLCEIREVVDELLRKNWRIK